MTSAKVIRKINSFRELLRKAQPESYLCSDYVQYYPGANGKPTILYYATTYDYGIKKFGLSYEELNFFSSLLNLGYGLIKCDSASLVKKLGTEGAMDVLDCAVNFYDPDFVIFVFFKDDYVSSRLEKIRKGSRAPFIGWFSDDHWRYDTLTKDVGKALDLCVTTADHFVQRYNDDGLPVHLSQWAYNPSIFRDLKLERDIDVCFIGQNYGNRGAVIETLRESGFRVEVRGRGWSEGRVSFTEAVRIINRSKVALNLSEASNGKNPQIKGRDFEVVPCGALLLTASGTGIERYFKPNEEIATYVDVENIKSHVAYAVTNEWWRKNLVNKAKLRAAREHTWEARFSDILSTAKKR